ncbi:MAG TPA: universal stress protein [Vicinamibacterales bacterium]|nr:universal stress protein [Vicinamibacterales bacterium]
MNVRPSILCPIDYSEASAGALHYAAALAEHFVARLIVLTVEDPLLTTALDLGSGVHWTRELSEHEVAGFAARVFGDRAAALAMCEYDVAVGKPPVEILRVARERSCDLIVMSSHGLTGARKLFFGSTTERVLRETSVPVLITPPLNPGPVHVEDATRLLHRMVVPVDLSPASLHQTQVARGIAEALNLPLVLVHVIEPVKSRLLSRHQLLGLDSSRRTVAEDRLDELVATLPRRLRPEALLVFGDPAEEAAKVVRDRQAGLVVMGLHGSPMLGPRMGSVTYRMLCLMPTLVLALPPKAVQHPTREVHQDSQAEAQRPVAAGGGRLADAGGDRQD